MPRLRLLLGFAVLVACAEPPGDDRQVPVDPAAPAGWSHTHGAFASRDRAATAAQVRLPARADRAFAVEDPQTGARVEVLLPGARSVAGRVDGDTVVYEGALGPGRNLVQRRTAAGVEDYVGAGATTSLRYAIRLVRGVAGLRLVGGVLEMLDAAGAPRLRAARARVLDDEGIPHAVDMRLLDCNADTDPRAPWGRPVVDPGADTCTLELSWREDDRAAWVDPGWETTGSLAIARSSPMVTTLSDGHVLAVGGYPSEIMGTQTSLGELWDPTTGTWAATASLPDALVGSSLEALDAGHAIVIGGEDHNYFTVNRAYRYDGASFVGIDLPHELTRGTSVRIADGRVVVLGGYGELGTVDEVLVFDPTTNGFSVSGHLPFVTMASSAATFTDAGKEWILVAGGFETATYGNRFVSIANAALVDTATFEATVIASMPTKRATAFVSPWGSGKIVVGGGTRFTVGPLPDKVQFQEALADVEAFDVAARSWSPVAPLPLPWVGAQAAPLSTGSVLVVGGCGVGNNDGCDTFTDATYRLSPKGAWESAGPLSAARAIAGMARLPNDRVLVVGGEATNVVYPLVDLFSPSQNGEPCSLPGECASQQCVEGVCCDVACGGPCESCRAAVKGNGTDGTCGPVPRNENPKGACKTASDCTREECDGAGTCVDVLTMCAPYQCADLSGCLGQCTSDTQCQQGFACFGGTCIDVTTLCVGSVGKDRTSGQSVECAPYLCTPDGGCRESCADSSQCAEGRVCNAESRCVQAAPPDEDGKKTEDEGCAVAVRARDVDVAFGLFGTAAALAFARRRRRGR